MKGLRAVVERNIESLKISLSTNQVILFTGRLGITAAVRWSIKLNRLSGSRPFCQITLVGVFGE